jgi:hypothetical protein
VTDDDTRREARLRRAAARQGLQLQKSHARDPRAITYGTFQLADPVTGTLQCWANGSGYGLTLDEVAEQLGEADE